MSNWIGASGKNPPSAGVEGGVGGGPDRAITAESLGVSGLVHGAWSSYMNVTFTSFFFFLPFWSKNVTKKTPPH